MKEIRVSKHIGNTKSKDAAYLPRLAVLTFCLTALLVSLCFLAAKSVFPKKYSEFVSESCARFDLEESEVYAVIMAESRFESRAVSRAGACGLMQLMPSTGEFCAEMLGLNRPDLFDAETNITLGCCYLSYLKQRFDGSWVYAAYNAGEGNVRLWLEGGGEIRFSETAEYVKRVELYKRIYKLLYRV